MGWGSGGGGGGMVVVVVVVVGGGGKGLIERQREIKVGRER
jgi:hypothetical protein